MPERSKRRKYNKNKRKNNKNNQSSINKNNKEENQTISIESGSGITKEDVDKNNIQIVKECYENQSKPSESCNVNSEISAEVEVQKVDEVKKEERRDDSIIIQTYIVETPEQANKTKLKLNNGTKSKSCDNDDTPTIVEITEDGNTQIDQKLCAPVIDSSNVIISNEESDIEWENVDDFKLPQTELIEGVLSSTTIPLNIAQCEHTKTLSPEEESSLRNYLQTLNLATSSTNSNTGDIKTEIEHIINREIKYRLRRKGLAEDNIYPRTGPSRSLAVIDEEGSSGSSKTSRRQSYLSDKKSDNEELEDEVFENTQAQRLTSVYTDSSNHLIPQPCLRVDAKLKEPEISEARGDWTVQTVEKMTGAELVYLTDSSSSTSSIYDANDDFNKGEESDTSVRIITPTIEVTDTETLLSNSFLAKSNNKVLEKRQEKSLNETGSVDKQVSNNTHSSSNINIRDNSDARLHLNDSSHEIVVLSTDNLETNLYVKDLNEQENKVSSEKYHEANKVDDNVKLVTKSPKDIDEYDLEIKVLKCELNDAINNLIKEVISDSENSNESLNDTLKRQDSSSSLDSSQCTAKYNPTNSSLNDISNLIRDEECNNTNKENTELGPSFSHVKDVLQCITNKFTLNDKDIKKTNVQPLTLRDTCLKKISSFPFGDKILEELANVSQRLQNTVLASQSENVNSNVTSSRKENSQIPPPIQPRKSSLKVSQDEQIKPIVPQRTEPVYECLSPSQKVTMDKTNTFIGKDEVVQTVEICGNKTDINVKNFQDMSVIGDSLEKTHLKSKTGSRLLALLRDTSNTPKLNLPSLSSTSFQSPKVKFNMESYSKKLIDEIDSANIPSDRYLPRKFENTSSYFYESDSGIRENSFRSLRNNKKYFHYSTGNLSKEIESDISSIQNMHRYCTNVRDKHREDITPRRPSLPKDLCDQQMEYICQKEKEIDAELRRLEVEKTKPLCRRGPRAPMFSEKEFSYDQMFDSKNKNYVQKPIKHQSPAHAERRNLSSLFSSSEEELLREKMYSEYVNQIAEREQRKQHKVIKITQTPKNINPISKSMPALETLNLRNNLIEQEFISKAKERWYKLGIKDPETEDEQEKQKDVYREPKIIEHKIKVIESGEEKDVQKLPTHMQEFVRFTVNDKDNEKCNTGESDSEQASAHVVVFCAVVILVLAVGKFLLRLFR